MTEPADSLLPAQAVPASPASSLLRTKLYRPRSRSDLIPRARLLERLTEGLSGMVTLVCAPAGFGKTTLLAQWLETMDRPVAWLSLDEDDNELAVFVRSLAAALQSVVPDAFGAMASLFNALHYPPPAEVASLVINDLADVPREVVLVLDDYHRLHSSEVHTLLELLIEHLPPQAHLVLASRSDPPLPLARWVAKGYLHELRRADLRFTLAETQAFLTRMLDSELARESAGELEELTEGWIAVLRLAAVSLRSSTDRVALLDRLHSTADRSISNYLVEEILSKQAPLVQEVLERTALVEPFCAELCVAVMGSGTTLEQVQTTLDWLEHTNLFLVPLDERQGWYRLHHLFRRVLAQRLQAHSSQEELAMLHRRASGWYAGQGLVEEAIEQALLAGEAAAAAQLVEAHFLRAFEQEQWVQMEHLLRLLPEEQLQGSPLLLLARVWTLLVRGQLTDLPRLLTAAEQLVAASDSGARDPDDAQSRLLPALIALGWSAFQYFTGQAQASLESARSAIKWLSSGEELVASYALEQLAESLQSTGREDVALVQLQQALREHSTHANSTARLLLAQALVYLAAGKLPQLEQTARHLLRLAQESDLALSQHWAHWLVGYVSYEWNNLDAAVYHFSAVVANRHRANFWAVREAMRGLALTYQAQGLGKEAQETARTLLEWVQDQHNMGELMLAYAFCGRLALLQDEVELAQQWLELAGEQAALGPMLFLEDPPITKARLLLAQGDEASVTRGQALLDDLLPHVEAMHSTPKMVQVLALQAWAYELQGRETEAFDALEQALALGRPGGFIRTFADLPPLARLLQELRRRRKARQTVDSKLDGYVQSILAAMSPMPSHAVSKEEVLRQEGLEPLTERELQILFMLDRDLTNKEIAHELVVTPGTVKVHTSNVYRKLSVTNRRAAVTLSKALGLLDVH